jgi:glycosyltransferase involved in cell wall biosynthesis
MKISVITVIRNCESTIENTIRSVLNQSYKNIEYIVLDGASTDNTFGIIT